MKAIIAGAGLGGLTAAIALHRAGWEVAVYEQAAAISEVGAGIQVSPNGTRILERLGVMERLAPAIYEPETIEMRDGQSGDLILSMPMRAIAQARWGARYFQVYRPDIIAALHDTLLDLAPDAIRLNARVVGYETGAGATAILDNGDRVEGDLLIGADGLRSAIRAQMIGPDAPVFTGNVAWRSVVPAERLGALQPPPAGCIWTGSGKHAVTTRMRRGSLVNFVGIVEQDSWREEGWSHPGTPEEALADFGTWHPTLTNIIEQSESLFRWALFGRAPLLRWSDGNAVLLGDAAHPMLPSMAQGAVQAFEDAAVLVRDLSAEGSVAAACQRYFRARIARATRVQKTSAANARLFHKSGPFARLPIRLAGMLTPKLVEHRYDWLYGAKI